MLTTFVTVSLLIGVGNTLKSNDYILNGFGYRFQPANDIELFETFSNIRSVMYCGIHCHRNIRCRTFQYDSSIQECRLFEGSFDTGKLQINFSSSIVGWINITPQMFTLYNATKDKCKQSRFLNSTTVSGFCECPINTFWNGSMCLNKRYEQQTCINNNWCRTDLFYVCNATKCITFVDPANTLKNVSNGILLTLVNPTSSIYPTYTYYSYIWTATGSSAKLSFFFRHDPGGWMLDDVKVNHNMTQLIDNGGFESGNLNSWTYSGSCNYYIGKAYYDPSYAKSGSYYYYDRCAKSGDTISQTFSTVPGDIYVISFWLTNYYCCSKTEIANVTIY